MFRRPKKSIRPRVITMGADEEEDNGMEVDSPPEETKRTVMKKEDRTKEAKLPGAGAALLSFHHEEENDETEVFKVKKSSVSRKLIKQRDKEKSGTGSKPKSESIAAPLSKADYNADRDRDRKSTSIKGGDQKGLGRILAGREAEAVDMESESDEDDNNLHFRRPARSNVTEAVRLTLERAQIPDANLIHEAKKRRQLAREMQGGAMPATISLNDSRRAESTRFIREDDDNDKSDEDDDRIDFSNATNADKIDREKRVEVFNAAEDENRDRLSEESDIEIDEWEKQQISKAIRKSQIPTSVDQNFFADSPQSDYSTSKNDQLLSAASSEAPKEKLLPAPSIKSMASPAVTIDDIISGKNRVTSESIFKRLADRLDVLRISRDRNAGELSRITNEFEIISDDKGDATLSKPKLSSRYILFQKLQGYFADLIDCMRYKIPIIESIEKRVIELMTSRSTRFIERRRKDTSDQLEEINAFIKAVANNTGSILQPPMPDEARMKRAAEREGRRTRRRRNREVKSVENHKDGLSSDDEESEFEINSYKIQMESLFREATTVFEDVSDDFSTIEGILAFFMEWRVCDFDSYKESYAYMCISKCVAPLIRIEILRWDPLVNDLDFNQFSWVKSLLKYNYRKEETLQDICTDVDSKLIPAVAEKVLVPWVEVVVKAKWDPTSTSQTRKLVNVVKKLIVDWFVAPSSKSVRSLLGSIISKFKSALENDVYIPIFPKHATATKSSPASVFASRQFWSGVKLLDNMAVWAGIISDDALQILALDALLTRYLLLGIRTAPELAESVEKANGVLAVIPTVWISKDPDAEPPNGIQQFIHCLLSMVQSTDFCLATNKLAIQDVAKILRSVGCTLEADMIIKKYT